MTHEYIQVTYERHASAYGRHVVQKKNKSFKSFFLFQNIFFKFSFKISDLRKNSLHAMAVLGYLPKLKRDLELAFGAHFLHGFFMQMLFI